MNGLKQVPEREALPPTHWPDEPDHRAARAQQRGVDASACCMPDVGSLVSLVRDFCCATDVR